MQCFLNLPVSFCPSVDEPSFSFSAANRCNYFSLVNCFPIVLSTIIYETNKQVRRRESMTRIKSLKPMRTVRGKEITADFTAACIFNSQSYSSHDSKVTLKKIRREIRAVRHRHYGNTVDPIKQALEIQSTLNSELVFIITSSHSFVSFGIFDCCSQTTYM